MLNYKYNSLNAKIYRWFYDVRRMPNLCPYFWKSVIMWILMIPTLVLSLPYMIATFLGIEKANDWFERIFGGVFLWLATFAAYMVLCAIAYPILLQFHYPISRHVRDPALAGTVLLVGVTLILGYFYIEKVIEKVIKKYRDNKKSKKYNGVPEERTANLLIEGIKSFYHKHCPQIEWKNAPNNN